MPSSKASEVNTTPIETYLVPSQLQSYTSQASRSSHSKNLQHSATIKERREKALRGKPFNAQEIRRVSLEQKEERKEVTQPVNVAVIECGVSVCSVQVAHSFLNKVAWQLRLNSHLFPIQGTNPTQLVENLLHYATRTSFGYIVLLVDKAEITAARKEKISLYKDLLEETQVNASKRLVLIFESSEIC